MQPIGLRGSGRDLITDDFVDPALELIHLLTQAAGLEHSLMLAYLQAAFSLKDEYTAVPGAVTDDLFGLHRFGADRDADLERRHTLLDVAVEEMQHLGTVNRFLTLLGAAPVLAPHAFPLGADIYPFAIDLRPLTRPVAATFLWVEAEAVKLSGDGPGSESEAFIEEVKATLRQLPDPVDEQPRSHLGSLYHAIVRVAAQVAQDPPRLVDPDLDWPSWLARMDWILGQGEIAHYRFFRSIFSGEAFGDPGGSLWDDPSATSYPSVDLRRGTAWRHGMHAIENEDTRRLAWFGNLHYWLILGLLDRWYRGRDRSGRYEAVGLMTTGLWQIGLELAHRHGTGLPFDPLGPGYEFGIDDARADEALGRLAREASRCEIALARDGLLPPGYRREGLTALLRRLTTA